MRKLGSILMFVFVFTFTAQAQKKKESKKPQFTVEQRTVLAVKKMTLKLDLSTEQQNQIRPILLSKIKAKKTLMVKRRATKKEDKRPTSDEIYAMKIKMLDQQIAIRKKMKEILNTVQFEKFEKMHKKMMHKERKERKKERRR